MCRSRLERVLLLALALLALILVAQAGAPSGAAAAGCKWQGYEIKDRENVTCVTARRVLKAYFGGGGSDRGFDCEGFTDGRCTKGEKSFRYEAVIRSAERRQPRITVASRTATLSPGFTSTSVSARCPAGYQVTAGGGEVADPTADRLLETFPETLTTWVARATRGAGASGDSTLKAWAVCAKNVRLRARQAIGDYAGGQTLGRSGILCPNDFSPTGAGLAFANPGFDTTGALIAATPRNSRVTEVKFRQNNPDQFGVSVICAKPRVTLERAQVSLPATGEIQAAFARCPRGQKLIGGGAAGNDRGDVIAASFPAGRPGRRTWTAFGYRLAGRPAGTLEVTAVCLG